MLNLFLKGLWRLSISPVTFVVLSILWCLDLGIGSLYAYWRPDLYGTLDNYPFTVWLKVAGPAAWPSSLWVHVLVVLTWAMVVSLLLCTANWLLFRRKRLKGLGEVLVHLGFLLVFAGYVAGAMFGFRTLGVTLPVGGSASVEGTDLRLALRGMRPLLGPGGSVHGAVSDLELTGGGGTKRAADIRINHPLMAGATVVYPRGVRQEVRGGLLLANGAGPVELLPERPVVLPGGARLELAGILQEGERNGEALGPGVLVTVYDAAGTPVSRYLSSQEGMPGVAELPGMRLELAGFIGPEFGVYDVHRDPGVWLVIVGALLITLGTAWAFCAYLFEQTGGATAPVEPAAWGHDETYAER